MKNLKIQSIGDLITNSSSEVFVIKGGLLSEAIVCIVKELSKTWINAKQSDWIKNLDDMLEVEIAGSSFEDHSWKYSYEKGDVVIYSTEDNSIPYDVMEAFEAIFNSLGVKWTRRHLG